MIDGCTRVKLWRQAIWLSNSALPACIIVQILASSYFHGKQVTLKVVISKYLFCTRWRLGLGGDMAEQIEIHRVEGLLTQFKNNHGTNQALVEDAYGWAKPVAITVGTIAAVGAGLYLLERGVGINNLLRRGTISVAGKDIGIEASNVAGSKLAAAATEAALTPKPALSTWQILESRGFIGKNRITLTDGSASIQTGIKPASERLAILEQDFGEFLSKPKSLKQAFHAWK